MRYIEQEAVQQYRGHEAILDPLPVAAHNYTVPIDSDSKNGEQEIHIGIAEPENPAGVLIELVSWSDSHMRPFHQSRLGTKAKFGNVRVVNLDLPGMGDVASGRKNELTEKQLEEAHNGRFTNLAQQYWKVIAASGALLDKSGAKLPVGIWSHSLSTLTAAELIAQAPEDLDITDLYMSEVMGLRNQHPARLIMNFLALGGRHLKDYLAMNSGMPQHDSGGLLQLGRQAVIQQRQSHYASVVALARGRHADIIAEACVNGRLSMEAGSETRISVIDAQHGLVAQPEHTAFSDQLLRFVGGRRSTNLLGRATLQGEYHGYQDSLPAVLDQMTKLALLQVTV